MGLVVRLGGRDRHRRTRRLNRRNAAIQAAAISSPGICSIGAKSGLHFPEKSDATTMK
jgi:hypothetical protein